MSGPQLTRDRTNNCARTAMSTTGRVAEGTPLCEECGVSPGVWRCGDGSCEPATGCNQLLCHACDEWIHAAGTLKSHTRTPVCSRCDRCGTGAVLACATCELRFCRSCSLRLHAKGTRAQHRISDLPPAPAQDGRVQEVNSSPASNPVVPTVAAPAAAVDASSSSSSPSVQVAAAAPAAAPAAAAVAAPTVPTAASDIGKPRCTFLYVSLCCARMHHFELPCSSSRVCHLTLRPPALSSPRSPQRHRQEVHAPVVHSVPDVRSARWVWHLSLVWPVRLPRRPPIRTGCIRLLLLRLRIGSIEQDAVQMQHADSTDCRCRRKCSHSRCGRCC